MLNTPAHWRIPPSFLDLSPFGCGESGRPLRVVIDDATVAPDTATSLLKSFEHRPGVEIFSTRPTAERRVEVARKHSARDVIEVRYVLPEGTSVQALGPASSWEERARTEAEEYGLSLEATRQGLLLAQASARHQVDALVTDAAVLANGRWAGLRRDAKVMSSQHACALLGLFLRAHNDFTVHVAGSQSTFLTFDRFYRGAAIAALPDYPSWLHSAWSMWTQHRDTMPYQLLRAVDARIGRALIARDYVNVRVRHWRPDETWGEVLYFFESFLLSLAGAIDAFARLLHLGLELPGQPMRAGFQHAKWRTKLTTRVAAPELKRLLAADSQFVGTVEAIGVLRNFVHAEMLSEELVHHTDGVPEIMDYGKGVLILQGTAAKRLSTAVSYAGGSRAWGISHAHDEDVIKIMPIVFMRAALDWALAGVRAVMAAHLLEAALTDLTGPFDPHYWIPTLPYNENLRLLAGVSLLEAAGAPSPSLST